MTEHELKTWPEYFQAIVENRKPFDYRLNDRDFKVGDVLHLREFVPPVDDRLDGDPFDVGHYTGRSLRKSVTYILDDKIGPTMREGFIVMGLGEVEPQPVVAIDIDIDRALIERTGLDAKLPPHFHWGADAMEQFDFGKRRAVEAILTLIDNPKGTS